jgi:hypothetical protein
MTTPGPEPFCCPRGQCQRQQASTVDETQDGHLARRVHNAGCAIAHVCRELNSDRLRNCFSELFGVDPECHLFNDFERGYRTEKEHYLTR